MEIKFRAKDKKTKQWVYGGYFKHQKVIHCPIGAREDNESNCQHLIIRSQFSDWEILRGIEAIEVDGGTVGQYIGKNR